MPKQVRPLERIPGDDHEPAGHGLEHREPRETVDRGCEHHVARPKRRRKRLCGNRLEYARRASPGSREPVSRYPPDFDTLDSLCDPDRATSSLRPRASGPIDQHPRRPACSTAAPGEKTEPSTNVGSTSASRPTSRASAARRASLVVTSAAPGVLSARSMSAASIAAACEGATPRPCRRGHGPRLGRGTSRRTRSNRTLPKRHSERPTASLLRSGARQSTASRVPRERQSSPSGRRRTSRRGVPLRAARARDRSRSGPRRRACRPRARTRSHGNPLDTARQRRKGYYGTLGAAHRTSMNPISRGWSRLRALASRSRAKVVDTCMLFNELDLLELRLRELWSVVDRFVVVEAAFSHAGAPKPLFLAENRSRFEPYREKLVYHTLLTSPVAAPRNEPERAVVEHFQRDAIGRRARAARALAP